MTPQRRASLLAGQTHIAQKVYQFIPAEQTTSASVLDIVSEMKRSMGSGMDIHILRGCLAALTKSGLIREVVPGAFRQEAVKGKKEVTTIKSTEKPSAPAAIAASHQELGEPIGIMGDIASRLRVTAGGLLKIADEIDAAAIGIAEHGDAQEQQLEKFRQFKALFKELG
ncbi:hypothetical protein KVP10_08425 [Candidimonas humi]|uniref:Uncharacterized protein n=1 Tax=Candidimonas humi TaxID=683355 RepID=A0ABV8NYS7_9BURK|nr:hypothetical protein [Candidimonas humi]MBV6304911.1 hypothetical protein [Candidimonas humi]